jgi:hypothetical protein
MNTKFFRSFITPVGSVVSLRKNIKEKGINGSNAQLTSGVFVFAMLIAGFTAHAENLPESVKRTKPTSARAVVSFRAEPGSVCQIYPSIPRSNAPVRQLTVFADANGDARFYVTTEASAEWRDLSATAVCVTPSGRTVNVPIPITPELFVPQPSLSSASPRSPRRIETNSSIGVLSSERVDVTTASEERLRQLGYPHRPDPEQFPQAYKLWLYAVTTPGAYVPARSVTMRDERHGPTQVEVKAKGQIVSPNQVLRLSDPSRLQMIPHRNENANAQSTTFALSTIWSGYVVENPLGIFGNPIVGVSGQWKVPKAGLEWGYFGYTASSEWVGIDGFGGNKDVIQAGTRQDVCGFFSANHYHQFESYYAWYEYYPESENAITGITVAPGDEVWVYVYTEPGVPKWTAQANFILFNKSTGQATIENEATPAGATWARMSAEWIMERPSYGDDQIPYPLAHYGYDADGHAELTEAIYEQQRPYGQPSTSYNYLFTNPIGISSNITYQVAMVKDVNSNGAGLSFAIDDGIDSIFFTWLGHGL